MSNNQSSLLPDNIDENDVPNTRRGTLARSGVAALFAQPSYETGEKVAKTNLTRHAGEHRPPPVARAWLSKNSAASNQLVHHFVQQVQEEVQHNVHPYFVMLFNVHHHLQQRLFHKSCQILVVKH